MFWSTVVAFWLELAGLVLRHASLQKALSGFLVAFILIGWGIGLILGNLTRDDGKDGTKIVDKIITVCIAMSVFFVAVEIIALIEFPQSPITLYIFLSTSGMLALLSIPILTYYLKMHNYIVSMVWAFVLVCCGLQFALPMLLLVAM